MTTIASLEARITALEKIAKPSKQTRLKTDKTYSLTEARNIISKDIGYESLSIHDFMPIFLSNGFASIHRWKKVDTILYHSTKKGSDNGFFEPKRENGSHHARLTEKGLELAKLYSKTVVEDVA